MVLIVWKAFVEYHFGPMRTELALLYEAKSDEELMRLAAEANHLTPEALTALRSELARRRIQPHERSPAESPNEIKIERQPVAIPVGTGVAEFITEVVRLYHRHWWLFFRLIVPAVTIGWFAVFAGRYGSLVIARRLMETGESFKHRVEFVEMALLKAAGLFASWTTFALSFGGICVSVQALTIGVAPSIGECFVPIRSRLIAFLRLSTLLFGILAVLQGAAGLFLSYGLYWGLRQTHLHLTSPVYFWIAFVCEVTVLLVLSRFSLAIPALLLGNCRVGESIFRSDEYTEGKWLILAALLAKSVVIGYLAAMSPFWLAGWLLHDIALPLGFDWVLTAASIAAVSILEPTMFIGFTLLYLQKSRAQGQMSAFGTGRQTLWR